MDYIVIDGSTPWRGRYEFDLAESIRTFDYREMGWIKKLSGYHPSQILDGLRAGDAELTVTLAVIALQRNEKVDRDSVSDVFDSLLNLPFGSISLELEKVEEADASPPEPQKSSNGRSESSGLASTTSSEGSDDGPSRSGDPSSASSPSVPATSGA